MTVTSASALGGGRVEAAADLSSAFGAAAVTALRRRDGPSRGSPARRSASRPVDEPETMEDDVQDSTTNHRPTSPPKAAPRPPDARDRLRVAAVRDRRQIDVLLLAVARRRPASGREFVALVRECSDGVFRLAERTVHHEVHRLTNDRLIGVTWRGGRRRYSLTPLGERVLATRRREWNAFSHGFDRVLDVVGDPSR